MRDSALALLSEIRPEFSSGELELPCHIVDEMHSGFFVNTGAVSVGIFRCQFHWWGHELEDETLEGLVSPNAAPWLSRVRMTPPQDMGTSRGGVPEFVAGLAFGLPTLDEGSLPVEVEARSFGPLGNARASESEFTARDLYLELREQLSLTEMEVIPFATAADGVSLQVLVDEDPLLYYRNFLGSWGERHDEHALGTVDGEKLVDITLPRLSVHVAWEVVMEQISARQRREDTSRPPNRATVEAAAFLRTATENSDLSVSELAFSYLEHLQFWTPDELKVPLGFQGPTQKVFDLVHAVMSEIHARLQVEAVIPRAEDDGSYTLIVLYDPESAVVYRLSPNGKWLEGDNSQPLTTRGGSELLSPATPQVVGHVASTIAFLLDAEYEEAEGNGQPIEVGSAWMRAIAFLRAVADGDVVGYESAGVIAKEHLDHARRWTPDSARAALGIGDRPPADEVNWENMDLSSIDPSELILLLSELNLLDDGEVPDPR